MKEEIRKAIPMHKALEMDNILVSKGDLLLSTYNSIKFRIPKKDSGKTLINYLLKLCQNILCHVCLCSHQPCRKIGLGRRISEYFIANISTNINEFENTTSSTPESENAADLPGSSVSHVLLSTKCSVDLASCSQKH